jgi:hypothetical protein
VEPPPLLPATSACHRLPRRGVKWRMGNEELVLPVSVRKTNSAGVRAERSLREPTDSVLPSSLSNTPQRLSPLFTLLCTCMHAASLFLFIFYSTPPCWLPALPVSLFIFHSLPIVFFVYIYTHLL